MTTIGIDLGTTNSVVAYHDGIKCEFIETSSGQILLPSVVSIRENGEALVGHLALRQMRREKNPEFVFSNIKRQIGLPFNEGEDYGIQIVDKDGLRAFNGPDRAYTPEELSAEILKTLKAAAERRIGKKVKQAVIAVPAYFNNNRVAATMEAARLAGLKPIIKTEPEMAGKAFSIDKQKFSRIAVFDLGGGTFDLVLMEAGEGKIDILQKDGWDELGGINFDQEVKAWLIAQYKEDEGKDLSEQQISLLKLAPVIEDAKRDLTDMQETTIEVMGVFYDHETGATLDLSYKMSRDLFDELTKRHIDKCLEITKRALDRNGWTVRNVDEVLLVGGMTRVPAVREAVGELFGKGKLRDRVNPDLAVAEGAAIAAAEEDGRQVKRTSYNDVIGQAFGVEGKDGKFEQFIPAGAPFGHVHTQVVTTSADGQAIIPIAILQGNEREASKCALIVRHDHKVKPGPAKSQSVELEFMVDHDGQLIVAGKDHDTGQPLVILEP